MAADQVKAVSEGRKTTSAAPASRVTMADLRSLDPGAVLSHLDLSRAELRPALDAYQRGDSVTAFAALLEHFRTRFPLPEPTGKPHAEAADLLVHRFYIPGTGVVEFPQPMDWTRLPLPGPPRPPDYVTRFYFVRVLAEAFADMRDERYAARLVELASDFFDRHSLTMADRETPDKSDPRRWTWMDLNAARRAQCLINAFPLLVHAKAATPAFLSKYLAWVFDHANLFEQCPNPHITHNMAMSEQAVLSHIAVTLPEFAAADRWMTLAVDRLHCSLLAQTTDDGVQTEWAPSYHCNVVSSCLAVYRRAVQHGIVLSVEAKARIAAALGYIYAASTPVELAMPMFGDTHRVTERGSPGEGVIKLLQQGAELLGEPRWSDLAQHRIERLPLPASSCFRQGGACVMRSDWSEQAVYLAMHNPPGPTTFHDEPDNLTFELGAFGRWLMPDTGFFTYGEDAEKRAWHRQTRAHQTLTLGSRDADVLGAMLAWHSDESCDAVLATNQSYAGLLHRRTVWFVARRFFVLLDEAIGDVRGEIDLHFQLAPGAVHVDAAQNLAHTLFDDANVLVWQGAASPTTLTEGEGWHAMRYRERVPRSALRFRHQSPQAPATFLTVLVPYRGAGVPSVGVSGFVGESAMPDRIEFGVHVDARSWRVGRDLAAPTLWCL